MANKKISELTVATAPIGAELIEIVQGGVNKQTTTQDIANLGGGGSVTAVTGTTNRITSTGGATPVIDIDAAYDAAITAQIAAAQVGLWDDRGTFDASVAAYPSSGGSGTAGAIIRGDIWTISVAGTLPTGQVVEIGDTVRALIDTPGNTQANWAILQNNIGFTPENSTNKVSSITASATLYPNNNAVIAYAAQIFVETATIYVDAAGNDSTGILGRADKPFLTITAALAAGAAVASLRIKIGMGLFGSPATANLRSNLWLEGSGKPGYNNTNTLTAINAVTTTDPSALVGGTILGGTLFFQDESNVHITDLGVDCGSSFVTAGGTEANQIAFLSATLVAPWTLMQNIVIKNVTTLGRTATSAFHALQLENCYHPEVANVDTYFSTHGVVSKNYGGIFSNIRANNHSSNGIIIKSDTYAFGTNTILDLFEIRQGGGLRIHTGSAGTAGHNVSNGIIRNATYGVDVRSDISPTASSYVTIDNVKVYTSTGIGFDVSVAQTCMVTNCFAIACTTGFLDVALSGNTFHHYLNCVAEACTTGFNVTSTSSVSILRSCSSRSNTTGFTFSGTVYASGLMFANNSTDFSGAIPVAIERGKFTFGATTAPTALIHLAAGTTTAGTGPIKFSEGVNPTSAEDGLINYVANNLTFTETTTVYTLAKTLTATATLNFDLTAVNYQDLTITVTGAVDGEAVVIGVPNGAAVADITFFGWVSAANTVTIRASRVGGGGAADPASGTFRASVLRY